MKSLVKVDEIEKSINLICENQSTNNTFHAAFPL